jgi:hypothetical protein
MLADLSPLGMSLLPASNVHYHPVFHRMAPAATRTDRVEHCREPQKVIASNESRIQTSEYR